MHAHTHARTHTHTCTRECTHARMHTQLHWKSTLTILLHQSLQNVDKFARRDVNHPPPPPPKKQSFHHKLKYSNRAKKWLILIKAFNLLTRKWCSFIDKERAISCNQMSQICMLNQARIIMHSAVNTVPHGGQIVNL